MTLADGSGGDEFFSPATRRFWLQSPPTAEAVKGRMCNATTIVGDCCPRNCLGPGGHRATRCFRAHTRDAAGTALTRRA